MSVFRLRRGIPCDVRRPGALRWRPHVCAAVTELTAQIPYAQTDHWVFVADGWEVRIAPALLEVLARAGETRAFGLTGTRGGMARRQWAAVREHFMWMMRHQTGGTFEFHHGGCVGADRDFHKVVRGFWGATARVVIHPAAGVPESLCDWSDADELREPLPPLQRNHGIVAAVTPGDLLFAAPKESEEVTRSGTWATVRAAAKLRKAVVLFLPDGSTEGRDERQR